MYQQKSLLYRNTKKQAKHREFIAQRTREVDGRNMYHMVPTFENYWEQCVAPDWKINNLSRQYTDRELQLLQIWGWTH